MGSAVAECLAQQGLQTPWLPLGVEDRFIEHAKRSEQLAQVGLNAKGIEHAILQKLEQLNPVSPAAARLPAKH